MDTEIYAIAIAILCAYLIGSFPTAYVVGRLKKGVDIREVGSRNMGAMNVVYTIGLAYGILVLVVDIGKGVAAILLARWLGTSPTIQLVAGGAAVLGHAFPVFLKFNGGKGGATSIGVLALLMPKAIPFGAGLFVAALLITRYPTFSYSLALACFPFVAWLIYHSGTLTLFSIMLLLILVARYLPRVKEMRSTGGSWRRVVLRRGFKDRL